MAARLALLVAGFLLATFAEAHAAGAMSYIDRRVTAIPAAKLLTADPNALIDVRRAAAAHTYGLYRRPLFLIWALSQIFAFYYLWNSGNAARLRDAIKRRVSSKFFKRFLFGAALTLYAALAALPASLAQFRVALVFDQLSQPFAAWLRDGAIRALLTALAVGFVVACVLTLVERTRQWWIYSIVGMFAAALLFVQVVPLTLAPLYNAGSPRALSGPLLAPLQALARAAGVPGTPVAVVNASRRTLVADATVSGRRVVVTDTLVRDATPGEVRYAVTREFIEVQRGAELRRTLLATFFFILCITLGVLVSDRIGFRRDDDPLARLALVFALAGATALFVYPLYNGYQRATERKEDAAALQLTHDPASAIRYFVRYSEERFLPVCPRAVTRYYFYDFDPLGTRVTELTGRPDPCP